eukprot:PhF_6_TR38936/c0_g1_i3/m.58257
MKPRQLHHSRVVLRIRGAFESHTSYVAPPPNPNVTIPATAVHQNPQSFWMQKTKFYTGKYSQSFFPTHDRLAHAAIAFTRRTMPLVSPDIAFRHIVLAWKALFTAKLTVVKSIMLPQLITGGVQMPHPEHDRKKEDEGKGTSDEKP